MTHLFVCREYPPAAGPAGGIGTYVREMTRLLAESGDRVHVIAQCWEGGQAARAASVHGRLVVHRVGVDDGQRPAWWPDGPLAGRVVEALAESEFPVQAFGWQASLLAEWLVEHEGVDVIEAPDWEAPLHYFLVRRLLGLGPQRQPPCVVHLHSPAALVGRHNRWPLGRADCMWAARQEEFVIRAADALVCPSRYLADEVSAFYGLEPRQLHVIPYPVGDVPRLARLPGTWESGGVCFVGRLEPRKGALEWVDAAVSVAQDDPHVHFDFVGSDTPFPTEPGTVKAAMLARIPRALRSRFRFHGAQSQAGVFRILRQTRIAVVPSQWDNLPYTCLEAMATGVPVLASPAGGMKELLVDGESGWIAATAGAEDLGHALRRALGVPAAQLAAMGDAAAEAVHVQCGNEVVLRRQRALKEALVQAGARHSTRGAPPAVRPAPPVRSEASADGMGVLATGTGSLALGLAELVRSGRRPLGVAVVADAVELFPEFLAQAEQILTRLPAVGVVCAWTDGAGAAANVEIRPAPELPYQWLQNDAGAAFVVRTSALSDSNCLSGALSDPFTPWQLVADILTSGWMAVTIPAILARRGGDPRHGRRQPDAAAYEQFLTRNATAVAEHAPRLLALMGSRPTATSPTPLFARPRASLLQPLLEGTAEERLALVAQALARPGAAVRHLTWRVRVRLAGVAAR